MTDTIAKIRAKGLDATGVTEEIASKMYRTKGSSWMVIAEVKVVEIHEKADGQRRVDLSLEIVEPALDPALEDHLRELTRGLYYNRGIQEGQLAIEDSLAPSVEEAIAAGARHRPHPYMASTLSTEDTPVCDVCGLLEDVALHNMPTVSPFEHTDDEEDPTSRT